jgi:hypothetical protein
MGELTRGRARQAESERLSADRLLVGIYPTEVEEADVVWGYDEFVGTRQGERETLCG